MKMKKILLAMSLGAMASVPAAASAADLTAAPDAEITLSTTVARTVPNDEAVLTLAVTRQGATAKDAQKAMLTVLNQGMKALRAALPAGKAVLQSGSLYTNPNYSQAKKGEGVKILNWTSREEVRVTLKDPSLAGEAIDAANALGQQHNGYAWAIIDSNMVDYFEKEGLDLGVGVLVPVGAKMTDMKKEIKDVLAKGSDGFKSGATIAELAKQIGVPAATLEETMKRYNENVAFGFDRDFYKEREWLTPINKGPFYAIKIAPYSFTSIGGIKIDQYMYALDKNNQPVKGLYCTGMDAGGMYGDSYPVWFSGNAFGFSSWSGRHAALQAIEDEKL